MSNLIKYPFVNMQGKEARVIEYEKQDDDFVPLEQKKRVLVKSVEEVEKEKEEKKEEEFSVHSFADRQFDSEGNDEFEAGLSVINYDEVLKEKEEEARQEAEAIVERAREDAATLLNEAREQIEKIREEAREEGIAQGKEEGLLQAQTEIDEIRTDLFQQKEQQEKEYKKLIRDAEGHYVEIVCDLMRNLTGVVVDEQREVILHLIRSGMSNIEPAKKYTIRVCSDDMLYVEANKEDIISKTGITGALEVQEEKGLATGECIIETDTQMIDCGFRTQLDNLVYTLRMLVK